MCFYMYAPVNLNVHTYPLDLKFPINTLTSMSNLINGHEEKFLTKEDFAITRIYTEVDFFFV